MHTLPPLIARPTRTLTRLHGIRCRLWTAAETAAVTPMRLGLLVAATVNHGAGAAAPVHRRILTDAIQRAGEHSPLPLDLIAPDPAEVLDDAGALAGADRTALVQFAQAVIEMRTAQRQHHDSGCRLAAARAREAEHAVDQLAQVVAQLLGA